MNKARAFAFRILSQSVHAFAVTTSVAVAASALVACADENDPKTWVKRLDDPAQRTPAIKKLNEMFDSAMSNSGNNREDPKVKAVVDDATEALAKTYVAGNLDEKTRKDLMKLLAETGDPRASVAFAKAFQDYEPGKDADFVKFAAQGTSRLANANKLADHPLIDALWDCFAKLNPSPATSIR